MRVLVTGGNGFVGSYVVEALLRQGHRVICLVRRTSDLRWIEGLEVAYRYGDVRDERSLREAVKGVEAVVHLAGLVKASSPDGYLQVNAKGTENLLRACEGENSVRYFLLMSSLSAAGPARGPEPLREEDEPHPISTYGWSKLMAERLALARSDRFRVGVLRPPAVYGPRDTEVLTFFRWAKRGILPIPAQKPGWVSLIYVEDLARACVMALEREAEGVYFVAHPETTSWEEVGRTIAQGLERRALPLYVPFPLVYAAALCAETASRLSGRAVQLNREKVTEMAQPYWICDPSKAKRDFGFQAEIDVEEGMDRTLRWYLQEGWL